MSSRILQTPLRKQISLLSTYRHRYRLHQAYSRYPRLSLAADLAKTAGLTGIVVVVGWVGYTVTTHQADSALRNPSALVQSADTTIGVLNEPGPGLPHREVEIPAAAAPVTTAKSTLAPATETPLPTDQKIVYTSGWIARLPADKYIIQVASSSNRQLLLKDALAFPTGPVAIYPFKKSAGNRTIYGLSSGVFNNFEDAQRAIEILPRNVISNGPWIRPVGPLKKQIEQLSVDS